MSVNPPNNAQPIESIFHPNRISQKVFFTFRELQEMTPHIDETLRKKIANNIEGKCIKDGYVRPNSVKIHTYSTPEVGDADTVSFNVIINCETTMFTKDCVIQARVKKVLLPGIMAESHEYDPSPFLLYILKEHQDLTDPNSNNPLDKLKEGDIITAQVTYQTLVLNNAQLQLTGKLIS